MTVREAKSVLSTRWPRSPEDERWLAEVDSVDLDQLWIACALPAPMLIALLQLGAPRRTVALATVACLREVQHLLTPALVNGPVANLEELAATGHVGAEAHARARDICQQEDRDERGAAALAALGLRGAIDLLDPEDAAPTSGGEMDCLVDALSEDGLSRADAEARLVRAIRREIPWLSAWPGLDATVGEVPVRESEPLPFS